MPGTRRHRSSSTGRGPADSPHWYMPGYDERSPQKGKGKRRAARRSDADEDGAWGEYGEQFLARVAAVRGMETPQPARRAKPRRPQSAPAKRPQSATARRGGPQARRSSSRVTIGQARREQPAGAAPSSLQYSVLTEQDPNALAQRILAAGDSVPAWGSPVQPSTPAVFPGRGSRPQLPHPLATGAFVARGPTRARSKTPQARNRRGKRRSGASPAAPASPFRTKLRIGKQYHASSPSAKAARAAKLARGPPATANDDVSTRSYVEQFMNFTDASDNAGLAFLQSQKVMLHAKFLRALAVERRQSERVNSQVMAQMGSLPPRFVHSHEGQVFAFKLGAIKLAKFVRAYIQKLTFLRWKANVKHIIRQEYLVMTRARSVQLTAMALLRKRMKLMRMAYRRWRKKTKQLVLEERSCRRTQLRMLKEMAVRVRETNATHIQRVFRGYHSREFVKAMRWQRRRWALFCLLPGVWEYQRQRHAAPIITRFIRNFNNWRRDASTRIQAVARMRMYYNWFRHTKRFSVLTQAVVRCYLQRARFVRYISARRIQALARCFIGRMRHLKYLAARDFQKIVRRMIARIWYTRYRAARLLQALVRGVMARVWYRRTLAAITIQCVRRTYVARRNFKQLCKDASDDWKRRRLERQKSIIIQRWYLTHYCRLKYIRRRDAARRAKQDRLYSLRAKRQARKRTLMYRTGRNISGHDCIVSCYFHTSTTVKVVAYLPPTQTYLQLILTDKQVTRVLDVVYETPQQLRYVLNTGKIAVVVKKLVLRKRVGEGMRLAVQYPSARGFRTQVYTRKMDDDQMYYISCWERQGSVKFELYALKTRVMHHFTPDLERFMLVLQDMPEDWRLCYRHALARRGLRYDTESLISTLYPPAAPATPRTPRSEQLARRKAATMSKQPPNPLTMAAAAAKGEAYDERGKEAYTLPDHSLDMSITTKEAAAINSYQLPEGSEHSAGGEGGEEGKGQEVGEGKVPMLPSQRRVTNVGDVLEVLRDLKQWSAVRKHMVNSMTLLQPKTLLKTKWVGKLDTSQHRGRSLVKLVGRTLGGTGLPARVEAEAASATQVKVMLIQDLSRQAAAGLLQRVVQWWKATTLAKKKLQYISRSTYQKIFSRDAQAHFYYNPENGFSTWQKPPSLANFDILVKDEWQEFTLPDGTVTFMNPKTGQYSKLTQQEAARAIQRRVRRRQGKATKLTLPRLVQAITLQNKVVSAYKQDPENFVNQMNYALWLHAVALNGPAAKAQYLSMPLKHPLALAACGLFVLAQNNSPREIWWDQGQAMIEAAMQQDASAKFFSVAEECFFRYSVAVNARHARAWLNLALVHQCITGEYDLADKFYRRAIQRDPLDKMGVVRQNFTDFLQRRQPGSMYFTKNRPTPLSQFRGKPAFLFDSAVNSANLDEPPRPSALRDDDDTGREDGASDPAWEALHSGLSADSAPWKLAQDPEVQKLIGDEWILMRDPKLPRNHKEAYFWAHQRTNSVVWKLPILQLCDGQRWMDYWAERAAKVLEGVPEAEREGVYARRFGSQSKTSEEAGERAPAGGRQNKLGDGRRDSNASTESKDSRNRARGAHGAPSAEDVMRRLSIIDEESDASAAGSSGIDSEEEEDDGREVSNMATSLASVGSSRLISVTSAGASGSEDDDEYDDGEYDDDDASSLDDQPVTAYEEDDGYDEGITEAGSTADEGRTEVSSDSEEEKDGSQMPASRRYHKRSQQQQQQQQQYVMPAQGPVVMYAYPSGYVPQGVGYQQQQYAGYAQPQQYAGQQMYAQPMMYPYYAADGHSYAYAVPYGAMPQQPLSAAERQAAGPPQYAVVQGSGGRRRPQSAGRKARQKPRPRSARRHRSPRR